jgi:Zn-dependent protease with chaperone function/uncharacterized RDD family membrane protein YckC
MPRTERLAQSANAAGPDAAAAGDRPELFAGKRSLRVPGERWALRLCILMAPLTIGLIGLLIKSVTMSDMILLVVVGMVYVSLSRGRLLGSSIRIHSRQMPELHDIVESTASRLGITSPQIFVRDDPFVPIAAVGVGEPYALMLSSQYLEHLRPGELRFLIARELAHIAAGHTRITSLLSVSGRENPAVALIFGAWLRRAECTADRVGLLCAESSADAVAAISITTFHAIGRRVDTAVLSEQQREIEADPTLRMGEWTSGMPYAVNRIARLSAFAESELARFWQAELNRPRVIEPIPFEAPTQGVVTRHDCAPIWRRVLAFGIDFLIVGIILHTVAVSQSEGGRSTTKVLSREVLPGFANFLAQHGVSLTSSSQASETVLGLFIYSTILVALSGQTLGMMVAELRVVTARFGQPGIVRTICRYLLATGALLVLPIALTGLVVRVQPHDRLSGTRVVRSRAISATLNVPATT